LFEAGCDDGTPGVCCGVPVVGFSREADCLESAIRIAEADVQKAGCVVERVQIERDSPLRSSGQASSWCYLPGEDPEHHTFLLRAVAQSPERLSELSGGAGTGGGPPPGLGPDDFLASDFRFGHSYGRLDEEELRAFGQWLTEDERTLPVGLDGLSLDLSWDGQLPYPAVPEPGGLALLATALLGLFVVACRRRWNART